VQATLSQPIDFNILPEQYLPRRISWTMLAGVAVVIALLLGLIPAYDALAATRVQTNALQARLNQTKTVLAQTQSEQAELNQQLESTEQQIEQTQAQITSLRLELTTLSQQQTHRSVGIVAAITALIPRVHLAAVAQEGDSFILTGQAGSQGLVLDYARALQASGQFANVRILSMINANPLGLAPEVEFSIEMEQ